MWVRYYCDAEDHACIPSSGVRVPVCLAIPLKRIHTPDDGIIGDQIYKGSEIRKTYSQNDKLVLTDSNRQWHSAHQNIGLWDPFKSFMP